MNSRMVKALFSSRLTAASALVACGLMSCPNLRAQGTDRLQVQIVGAGRLNPNYSNALLRVGSLYSTTAIPGAGYRLQSWTIGTNWIGGETKTSARINFTMQPGLTLQLVFADASRPTVQVSNLAQNRRLRLPVASNGLFTVQGTTHDNVAVTNVSYRLNGGAWTQAVGTAVWEAPLSLQQPSNAFEIYAQDSAGNVSLTNSVRFTYVQTDTITITSDGDGRVSRMFLGDELELGQSYTVRATPGTGQVFFGWDGTITSTNNPLTFQMQSNMTLVAHFVPNPFLSVTGNYNGLFYPDGMGSIAAWTDATNSGLLSLNLTKQGGFSGKIIYGGTNLPISGVFGLDMQSQVVLGQFGIPITITMWLDPDSGVINGSVEQGDSWSAVLMALRASSGFSNAFTGNYSLVLEGCDTGGCFLGSDGKPIDPAKLPEGDSPAAVKVTQTGQIQMTGTLADGTAISQNTMVSTEGYWPLYVAPYDGHGVVIGWLNFANYGGASMVLWQRAPDWPKSRYYTNGFTSSRIALVTPYHPPTGGQNAVPWTNGTAVINSGNLPAVMTNQITLQHNQLVSSQGSISNLTLTITPANGLFKGSFVHPVTGRPTSFQGIVVQQSSEYFPVLSGGWFLGTNAGGTLRLHAP